MAAGEGGIRPHTFTCKIGDILAGHCTQEALRDELGPNIYRNVARAFYPVNDYRNLLKQGNLGEGRYGQVGLYKDVSESLVAVKSLDPDNQKENISELAVLQYVRGQPNILPILGVQHPDDSESFPPLVMGRAGSDMLEESNYTSWNDIYNSVLQILHGYHILHSMGIAHRDTKPVNMLKTRYGEIWISDFGSSIYLNPSIEPCQDGYTGTRMFASPEVLLKTTMYPKPNYTIEGWLASDVWAVGASILFILTVVAGSLQIQNFVFAGIDTPSVLRAILKFKGTPTEDAGEVFNLLVRNPAFYHDKSPRPESGSIDELVRRSLKFQPEEGKEDQLTRIISVITAMLTYDPTKRPSITDAFMIIRADDPAIPLPTPVTRHSITNVYADSHIYTTMKTYITTSEFPIKRKPWQLFISHIHQTLTLPTINRSIDAQYIPFICDRASIYYTLYLLQRPESLIEPNIYKRAAQQYLYVFAAIYIATALFTKSGYMIDKSLLFDEYLDSLKETGVPLLSSAEFDAIINDMLMSGIPFLGSTVFDEITVGADVRLQNLLGLLNIVCHQSLYYSRYNTRLDILKREMSDFAFEHKDEGIINPRTRRKTFNYFEYGISLSVEDSPACPLIAKQFRAHIEKTLGVGQEGGRRRGRTIRTRRARNTRQRKGKTQKR